MAYKRTSKKTGATTRRTKTINTNGAVTISNSQGTKNFRTTHSTNSKTGHKTTQTWRDGAGYVHTRVISKTETEAQRRKKQREAQEFWAWIFGKKNRQPARKVKPSKRKIGLLGWSLIGLVVLSMIFGGK
jgi:hypothetical protein